MLKSSLCDYSDAYVLVKGTITVIGVGADNAARAADGDNKKAVFKNCAQFTDCITELNNTQVDNAKDLDVVMLMYNLIEYSENYSKTSGSLWQYCRDERKFLDDTNIVGIIWNKRWHPSNYKSFIKCDW